MEKEVNDFFEGVKAKKHAPPAEKIDSVKAKRTLAALKKPPKSPATMSALLQRYMLPLEHCVGFP